jgi:hypothetical protein
MTIIATPCYDGKLDVLYVNSLLETLRKVPDIIPIWLLNESIVQKARNELFRIAYESKADSVLWIDADETWTPDDVERIIKDEHDFVTGLVRQKFDGGAWCIRNPNEKALTVESCGMGFCKMTRKVVEELWRKSKPYGLGFRNVFECSIDKTDYVSEDIMACRKWSGKIYYRPDIVIGHIGKKIY